MKAQDPTEAKDTATKPSYWITLLRDQQAAQEFFSHTAPDGISESHCVAAYCALSAAVRKTAEVITRYGGLLLIGAPASTEYSSAVEASLAGGAA